MTAYSTSRIHILVIGYDVREKEFSKFVNILVYKVKSNKNLLKTKYLDLFW